MAGVPAVTQGRTGRGKERLVCRTAPLSRHRTGCPRFVMGSGIFLYPTSTSAWDDFVPRDATEGKLLEEAQGRAKHGGDVQEERKKLRKAIEQHREDLKQARQQQPEIGLAPDFSNARISSSPTDEDKEDCGIRPHRINKTKCGASGGASHHGMLDFPFRTGTQEQTEREPRRSSPA